jgi:hypothetical protein
MPTGPKGQKRPVDVIGNAVLIAKIATGEADEKTPLKSASKGGKRGGKARAKALSPEQRSEIARIAAEARWKKSD